MLEHSAMFLNVPPQYEDDTSFFPDFYTRLGPCELQDPVWAKMSALTTGVKKRKKSETKPQAQINKCNNEKRRREQENIYIEELAELISANISDMSSLSVKPDKCAILQATVNEIRTIKKRESQDPVQQGEVSSSRHPIIANEIYGPLLLEALEGFLFVVNADGRVEHVTENIAKYIKFTKDEVYGKSIYNIIHLGDHHSFNNNLMPTTIGWTPGEQQAARSRSCSVRFLVKSQDEQEESVEEKQQRISAYELMHISSTQLKDRVSSEDDAGGADCGPYLLCVASRISHRDKVVSGLEQFTTRLTTGGKIVKVDAPSVPSQYAHFISKDLLMERMLRDLVPQQEVHKINAHLRFTINEGHATSDVYRLQVGQDKYVQVQTKFRFFKANPQLDVREDFIMATHSIVGEYDAIGPSDPEGGLGVIGGPLMTSVANGARNGTASAAPASSGSDSSTASSALLTAATSSSYTAFSMENEFPFDMFPTSTFELEPQWNEPRPDSRQSATPVSTPTPRPPSNPAYSPATTVAPSPLAPFVTQPSPSTPASAATTNPYGGAFGFSPMSVDGYGVDDQKDTKANVLDEASTMMSDSNRLRNLLTQRQPAADSSGAPDADGRNKNKILKGLLNQQDEDERSDNRTSPRGAMMGRPGPSQELPKASSAGGNNMLLQLLNEKSDDDDLEAKAGVKKKSELLQQLLKADNRDNDEDKKEVQSNEDSLLRSLGFNSPSSPSNVELGLRGMKRSHDETEEHPPAKRQNDGKLSQRNKMLASLLAKQPNNQHPIPHIPVSLIAATPQDILPRVSKSIEDPVNSNSTAPNAKPPQSRPTAPVPQPQPQRNPKSIAMNESMLRMGRQPNTSYLTTMLTHSNSMHQRVADTRQMPLDSGCYSSPATSSTDDTLDHQALWLDKTMQSTNDPLLSDILDQVMDIVPDEDGRNYNDSHQRNNLSETMAINMIQKTLMQWENVVTSPGSPTMSMPGTPPAYSAATMQNSQIRGYPPPPNYHQTGFMPKQRMPSRPGAPQYANVTNAQLIIQRKQQQEDKRRLLQQQQQQELLIPSNANAAEMSSGMQNIDSLLNNSVAPPNVTLQRSSSLPESQLSPGYTNAMAQNRLNQQPYSPHAQLVSPLGQQGNFQGPGGAYQQSAARLSPQFNQQMSMQQSYAQSGAPAQNWPQQNQQAAARLSLRNPMLNAQLQRTAGQQPQSGQQRALNSPGTVSSRHSPYPQEAFPPPTSPNSAAFNQNQYLRLQRANSVPTATTQLPGGLASPRPYGREHHPHPYSQIPNPHQHPPMMYQQDSSQYCYDQTGLQLAYNGADRGRAPPHLQPGASGSNPTSEYVRNELRAVVGARTGQAQSTSGRPPSQMLSQAQQQVDLENLGLSFEMPPSEYYGGGASR